MSQATSWLAREVSHRYRTALRAVLGGVFIAIANSFAVCSKVLHRYRNPLRGLLGGVVSVWFLFCFYFTFTLFYFLLAFISMCAEH